MAPSTEPSTTTIDKRGDVMLQLGATNPSAVNLLVSSRVLGLASPVFEAMFNNGFAEGQDLSSRSPRAVPLPDDDPTQMAALCKIIHMKTGDIPIRVGLIQLAEFAVLSDKYQCIDAVRPWSKIWALSLIRNAVAHGYETLLFATYILDLPHEFYSVTKALICERIPPVDRVVASYGRDLVPSIVLDEIETRRHQNEIKAWAIVYPQKIARARVNCNFVQLQVTQFVGVLSEVQLLPPRPLSLEEVRIQGQELLSKTISIARCGYVCECSSLPDILKDIVAELEELARSVTGCCLDCIIREQTQAQGVKCRMAHDQHGQPQE